MNARSWIAAFLLAGHLASAAEPEVQDLPRLAPTPPAQALSTFQVKPGFRLELAAAEPVVVDPIAMAFDEQGRLFVVEMRDYSERRDERLGRIRLLEDVDGDGRFEKSTVFADDLPWPTAVICYNGGIFVGATPDIFYLKDTNGDGVADERKVVFTGFAKGVTRLNVQAMFNSFTWGLDNRIHGATSGSGGSITAPGATVRREPVELRGVDFSFDPRTLELRRESGGGQHGLSFDNQGRKFVCSNSSHLQAVIYEERYAGQNPFFVQPRALVDIAVDGPAAEVYRISPDEAWRVLRTQWRVSGLVPGPVEGGGRPSGYFTGATGVMIYRGDAFPEEFLGDAFVADCGSNLVHRKKVRPDGVSFKGERPADEQKVEFVASRDNWFRPVQFANAPDGTLYIADMYREIIEHPWSLPDSLKKHLDLNSGNDRGRIYRIVPEGFQRPPPPRLGGRTTAEWVATLEHRNGWHRDTAARLLSERRDQAAVPLLEKLVRESKSPLARLHGWYALRSQGALTGALLAVALADQDEAVRRHGVRLAEELLLADDRAAAALAPAVIRLADDPARLVRYQCAFALGQDWPHPDKTKALTKIARRDVGDPWIEGAVLNSLKEGAATVFAALADGESFRSGQAGRDLLARLAALTAAGGASAEVSTVVRSAAAGDATFRFSILGAIAQGFRQSGRASEKWIPAGEVQPILRQAVLLVQSASSESERIAAVRILGLWKEMSATPELLSLLEPVQPQSVQSAALSALQDLNPPNLGGDLLQRWPRFTPGLRAAALELLLKRKERLEVVFGAIESGRLSTADFSVAQVAFLRSHPDAAARRRADRLFGTAPRTTRGEIIDSFLPALKLEGDTGRGELVFQNLCAACHRLGGNGPTLGPDLVTAKNMGKEKVLINLLDPNREVQPAFVSYLIETRDGESLAGIIGNETASSVTLKQANGLETAILRSQILSIESQGKSAMPEGLETGLRLQDLADLLEFIVSGKLSPR